MNSDTARRAYLSFCLEKERRLQHFGAKSYTVSKDITAALGQFKTFNGAPLTDLLQSYGIHIARVDVAPGEVWDLVGGLNPGDLVYSIELESGPSKTMPCHLTQSLAHRSPPDPMFVRRGAEFPVISGDALVDPLVYWATTGKCLPTRAQ